MVTALLVTSAATLFEAAPFILAAALLTQTLRSNARMEAYLGCGCGVGPSARSLPAAAATWLVFGPLVAGARLAGAILAARLRRRMPSCDHATHGSVLSELALIVPIAITGASIALVLPALAGFHTSPAIAFIAGSAAAFAMAPCALGAVGFAAALRATMPAAAAGFLCVAGIVDLRAWLRRTRPAGSHDAFSYALFAIACAIVAAHRGGGLVHPKLALALWPCALASAYAAYRFRALSCARLRIAPAVMLIGATLAAPLPAYHATETTLADAFAGERLDFTGLLTRTAGAATLVRYAITCCRADAAPIVVRLVQPPPPQARGWFHARGVLIAHGSSLRLRADTLERVAEPSDPFVYR